MPSLGGFSQLLDVCQALGYILARLPICDLLSKRYPQSCIEIGIQRDWRPLPIGRWRESPLAVKGFELVGFQEAGHESRMWRGHFFVLEVGIAYNRQVEVSFLHHGFSAILRDDLALVRLRRPLSDDGIPAADGRRLHDNSC